MNDIAILTAAIQKAVDNGWEGVPSTSFKEGYGDGVFISGKELLTWRFELWHGSLSSGQYDDFEEVRIEAILFNQEFAKALWGDSLVNRQLVQDNGETKVYKGGELAWQYHLQQMVIAEDRMAYLEVNQ